MWRPGILPRLVVVEECPDPVEEVAEGRRRRSVFPIEEEGWIGSNARWGSIGLQRQRSQPFNHDGDSYD